MALELLKILLVDDSRDQYSLIRDFLEIAQLRCTLDWIAEYEAALEIIARQEHDVYLIDYQLGEYNGLDLMRAAHTRGSHAPMILLTSHSERGIDDEALRIGAADYLEKVEIKPSTLERAIRYAVERTRSAAALRDSEERLRAFIRSSPSMMFALDREGRLTMADGKIPDLPGPNIGQLIGLKAAEIIELVSGQPPAKVVQIHCQRALGGETGSFTFDILGMAFDVNYGPLRDFKGQLIGVIGVARDITLLKQAEAAEREQRELAEALHEAAAALNSTLNFQEILDRILTIVSRVIPHDTANIMLIEGGLAHVVRFKDNTGLGLEDPIKDVKFHVNQIPGLCDTVLQGKPLIVPDVLQFAQWVDIPESRWIRSYAAVPIQIEGHIIGFLNLHSRTRYFFSESLITRLQAFSNQIAIAVQNARLYEQAQELAALNERQRLARELHDAVSQTLFSASVIAEALPRLAKDLPASVQGGLKELHLLNRRALAEMRALLLELRPRALVETKMDELLRQLADTFSNRQRIEVVLDVERGIIFPPDVQIALYRISQEALNNVAKHAQASRVRLSLVRAAGQIQLSVHDNGHGFDLHDTLPDQFGLNIMQERARAIGAHLKLISRPEEGTEIVVTWQHTLAADN
ncbi:MAG: response regulator [Chloroflexi bacterium]|nr:response regulator [Chloroflexota bacterium]